MITIYLADTEMLVSREAGEKYFALLDEERREKVRRCRRTEDRKRSLLAGCLIQTGVKEAVYGESGLRTDAAPLSLVYRYGKNGKPYLQNFPGIFFSLSHSGSYVLCAMSDEDVGADIQEHRGGKERVAERFFSEKDKKMLDSSLNNGLAREEMFYRIWTVKEAYVKLTGQGLCQGMDTVEISCPYGENGRAGDKAYYKLCGGIKNYSIAVCSYSQITDIVIKQIDGINRKTGKKGQ